MLHCQFTEFRKHEFLVFIKIKTNRGDSNTLLNTHHLSKTKPPQSLSFTLHIGTLMIENFKRKTEKLTRNRPKMIPESIVCILFLKTFQGNSLLSFSRRLQKTVSLHPGHYEGKTPYSYAYSCAHGAFMAKNTQIEFKRKLDMCL